MAAMRERYPAESAGPMQAHCGYPKNAATGPGGNEAVVRCVAEHLAQAGAAGEPAPPLTELVGRCAAGLP
jgi:cytochrome c2